MKLIEYLAAHGPQKTARALVNARIVGLIGLGIDDLADNCEMADMVDSTADYLESGDLDGARENVKSIDMEFIEENIYG